MTKLDDLSPDHLKWLIESRARNQTTALTLFKLFKDYPKTRSSKVSPFAEALVAIAFSLWRAAFLADKSGMKGKAFEDAETFLGKMLLDNAINYPQDRAAREWTFNYYVSNAHYRFSVLAPFAPAILAGKPKSQTPKARWTYYQDKLDQAVSLFEAYLKTL